MKNIESKKQRENFQQPESETVNSINLEQEPVNPINLELLQKQITDLQSKFESVQIENEELRKKRTKKLDYEEAQKVFTLKAKILKHIQIFEGVKKQLDEIKEFTTDSNNPFDSERYKLIFSGGYGGRDEILKISNVFVIEEFKTFIINKIDCKINELHNEVTSFEL